MRVAACGGILAATLLVAAVGRAAADLNALAAKAAAGDPRAQLQMAESYEQAKGVDHDLVRAAAYMLLAAERGVVKAQYRTGLNYLGGLGVPKDLTRGYKWLSLAASSAPEQPSGVLAKALRDRIADDMSPADIRRARDQVAAFRPVTGPAPKDFLTAASRDLNHTVALRALDTAKTIAARLNCGPPDIRRARNGEFQLAAFAPKGQAGILGSRAGRDDLARDGVEIRVTELSAPVCNAINALAGWRAPSEPALAVAVRNRRGEVAAEFEDGDFLVVDIAAGKRARYVRIDYVSHDGQVAHLYPASGDGLQAAGRKLVVGTPGQQEYRWQVGAPFGDDLLVVSASHRPLPIGGRPQGENARTYFAEIARLLDAAGRDNPVALAFRRVRTIPRRN